MTQFEARSVGSSVKKGNKKCRGIRCFREIWGCKFTLTELGVSMWHLTPPPWRPSPLTRKALNHQAVSPMDPSCLLTLLECPDLCLPWSPSLNSVGVPRVGVMYTETPSTYPASFSESKHWSLDWGIPSAGPHCMAGSHVGREPSSVPSVVRDPPIPVYLHILFLGVSLCQDLRHVPSARLLLGSLGSGGETGAD